MDLNKMLSELADEIDITESQEGAIIRAYNSVADWLNQNGTAIAKHKIRIFPQGSMRYGTAIKPINEDDYDIDLVCEFTEQIDDVEPEYVKKSVGKRIQENSVYKKMLDPEGRRCWTIQYSDNLNFHMDILPAIPFTEKYLSDRRLFEAYSTIKVRKDLALLATDKNKVTFKYKFIPTNPEGYAEWFKDRTHTNQRKMIFDSVERVPQYPTKTLLQKAIQLLKRHRDVYFSDKNDDYKPISMIITTLVAKCYNGENDLYSFLCKALSQIASLIERGSNGEYIVKNPVMENENFADKWNEIPEKADAFFQWVNSAYVDFVNLADISLYSSISKTFKEMFAQKPVDRLMQRYEMYINKEKSDGLNEKSNSIIEIEKLPHRKPAPWVLPKKYKVGIKGEVSYDNGKTYQGFLSGTPLQKNADLQFFPVMDIKPQYKVKWQITNSGEEARMANCLRGDRFEDGDIKRFGIPFGKKEETSYKGKHYIQCFIIKNGNQCVGYSKPFVVFIE